MIKRTMSFFLTIVTISAFAQEKDPNKDYQINEVLIQGKFLNTSLKNTNENITVISKTEIQNSPAKSIEELLQSVSGMDIRRRGSNGVQADISIRGSSFEQVLILVNGIRMNDSQTGHNSFNIPFDISSVDRIEIVKGPNAIRYGNNAYAGVINIITKPSAEENIKVLAEGGDYNSYDLGLSGNFGTEKFSNFIQVHRSASDGYRYNTDYKINNFYYQNSLKIKNGTLGLLAGFSEKKFGANGFYASPEATEQYSESQASIVGVSHNQNFGKFNLNSNLYWRRGQNMYIFIRDNPSYYRNYHLGNNVGGEINGSYKSSLGITGLGLELRKEILVSNNLGKRNRFVSQVFFEHHFSFFSDKLAISPGISWGNYSDNGNFFYPGLDAGYEFNSHHKIFGNISKVNRIPTFTDLYYEGKEEQGNPNLLPESAISTELGYRFTQKNFSAKTSFFTRDSKNAIDWLQEAPGAIWQSKNVGKTSLKGFEVELKQSFSGFLKSYSFAYTYIDNKAKNADNSLSRYGLENLKHQVIAKLENKFLKHFTNELVYRYTERVNLGSYHLLDEKLNFNYKNSTIYLLINNITNSNYTEANLVPMPRRWFHIGFTYDFHFKK